MQHPEIQLAKRLVERKRLVPPIDVLSLLKHYADVEFVDIPFGIDGLCLNLKAVGMRPTVLVQRRSSANRQRFTIAHELGHVLIPWHVGAIVDEIDAHHSMNGEYWAFEAEANQFASELLIPSSWLSEVVNHSLTPADALKEIVSTAEVSRQAAAIKLINFLPPGYVIAYSENKVVRWSARSSGTLASAISSSFDLHTTDIFPFPFEHSNWKIDDTSYDFWQFKSVDIINLDSVSDNWRLVLDKILVEVELLEDEWVAFKRSFAGVVGNANGSIKLNRSVENISTALIQRLHARAMQQDKFKRLIDHPNFYHLCHSLAKDFYKMK